MQLKWDAAAKRSVRAAIVIPGLFAFADKVIANPNVATFASHRRLRDVVARRLRRTAAAPLHRVRVARARRRRHSSRSARCARARPGCRSSSRSIIAAPVLFGGILSGYVAKGSVAALLILVLPLTLARRGERDPAAARGLGAGVGGQPRWPCSCCGATLRRPASEHAGRQALDALADAPSRHARRRPRSRRHVRRSTTPCAKLRASYLATPFRPTGATIAEQAIVRAHRSDRLAAAAHRHARRPARRRLRTRPRPRTANCSSPRSRPCTTPQRH